jgi:hypothetical protein
VWLDEGEVECGLMKVLTRIHEPEVYSPAVGLIKERVQSRR